ncbi:MAG: hypothetical protein NUV46_04485 [Nanoarchaeota archaeon]|nr:hypothetical protein [Nanoarchaeota archaeon]
MNKKAQFYFLAAIIFAAVFISVVTISNKATYTGQPVYLTEGEELNTELSYLLDYFSREELLDEEEKTILINVSNSYIERFSPGKESFFLFGKDVSLVLKGYKKNGTTLLINVGDGNSVVTDTGTFQNEYSLSGTDTAVLTLDGTSYPLIFYPGQNFYYLIKYDSNNQNFVQSGGTSS